MTLIDTEAAAYFLGLSANAVRIYASRYPERLPRRGSDDKGRTLYALEDVELLGATRRSRAA